MSDMSEKLDYLQTGMKLILDKVETLESIVNGYSSPFELYKGVSGKNGALQLKLVPLHKSSRDKGVVFLEAAEATSNNVYDWSNKITIALSLSDIAILLDTFRAPPPPGKEAKQIYHDKFKGTDKEGKVVTSLTIQRGEQYGWRWSLGRKENGSWRNVNIPVSDGEAVQIRVLLERAVSKILGW